MKDVDILKTFWNICVLFTKFIYRHKLNLPWFASSLLFVWLGFMYSPTWYVFIIFPVGIGCIDWLVWNDFNKHFLDSLMSIFNKLARKFIKNIITKTLVVKGGLPASFEVMVELSNEIDFYQPNLASYKEYSWSDELSQEIKQIEKEHDLVYNNDGDLVF